MTNFDRVADIYDATRGLPPDVAEQVADRIVAATVGPPDLSHAMGAGRQACEVAVTEQ